MVQRQRGPSARGALPHRVRGRLRRVVVGRVGRLLGALRGARAPAPDEVAAEAYTGTCISG